MASFTHTVSVQVLPERLWTLIRDVRWLTGLFPYISVDEMTSPEPGCWLFRRKLAIPFIADLQWHEETREVADREVHFRAVQGDLETFNGCWAVADAAEAATLTLAVEYAIPARITKNLPTPMVDQVMSDLLRTMCQKVKDAAEEGTA